MSAAIDAKSAKDRAGKAIRLLKTAKPEREGGRGLGREFDDCFEMGDGDEVYRIVITEAAHEPSLLKAIERHGYTSWVKQIKDPDNHWIWVGGTIHWEPHQHGPEPSLEAAMEYAEQICAPWIVVDGKGELVAVGDGSGRFWPPEEQE